MYLLTFVSDRTATVFYTPTNTQAVALDISKVFEWVWYTSLLQRFGLFLHLLVLNRSDWFWMICLDKSAPLVLVFLKVQFLVLHFFNYTLMIFLIMCSVILLFPLGYQIIVKSRLSILRQNSPVRCLFDKV